MFPKKWEPPKPKEEAPKFYLEVELTPVYHRALLDLIRKQITNGATKAPMRALLKRLETELLCARRMDYADRGRLPWSLARERGCSEIELFFDLAHAKEPE